MKVLHLINTLATGGAELHLFTLCRHLNKEGGFEIIVAHLKEGKGSRPLQEDFKREGIRVVSIGGQTDWDARYFLHATRLIKKEQPDILHTHLPRADLAGAWVKKLNPGLPWVCSIHGIYTTHWRGWWLFPLVAWCWRRADRVIAISSAVKQWLIKKAKVSSDRIEVVYYGIEPDRFLQRSDNLRTRLGLQDELLVGTLARLEPRKGLDTLVRAMPCIVQHIPNACLLIAGHDPWGYGATLRRLISDLGLQDRIYLLGFVQDVSSFLHALNVFAFASRTEGFGQVLIEAMAAGKPVVASRIPPLTEIVSEGETGLLADSISPDQFAQAIIWLLSHPKEATKMGSAGKRRVQKHFTAQRMVAETIRIYEKVLQLDP